MGQRYIYANIENFLQVYMLFPPCGYEKIH